MNLVVDEHNGVDAVVENSSVDCAIGVAVVLVLVRDVIGFRVVVLVIGITVVVGVVVLGVVVVKNEFRTTVYG